MSTQDAAASLLAQLRWLSGRIGRATGTSSRLKRRVLQQLVGQALHPERPAPAVSVISGMLVELGLQKIHKSPRLQPIDLPAVAVLPDGGLRFIYSHSDHGEWLFESTEGRGQTTEWPENTQFLPVRLPPPQDRDTSARHFFHQVFELDRSWMIQSAVASVIASVLVLATSLYSMQVYDRVIAHGGIATLIVLTMGVAVAIFIEFAVKLARSAIMDRAINDIDLACAQGVFARLLKVRMDQFPASVGTLSAQVRGFEAVRSFQTALRSYLLTDAPFALFFLFIIYLLGGPIVAMVPFFALIVAILVGWSFKRAVQGHSTRLDIVGNRRQGVLVEVIQAAEVLKATGAGWVAQSRWNELSKQTTEEGTHIKRINDLSTFVSGLIQQFSYVGLVAAGAYLATTSQTMTVGSIIACSIISGRVLTPINQIPSLLVQWAHSRVALENLEKLFALENDHHGTDKALHPEVVQGALELSHVEFSFPGQNVPLTFAALKVVPGERVAIVGGIGTGKSTLLKLLAGLIKPHRGQVLLDGMDIQHIDVERRAEIIGYLPQTTRLMGGTLRENLSLGVQHYSEDQILAAAKLTGLADLITARPEGLDLRIPEGGEGLSGGQKQLVALTRVILAAPHIWLLDEPTASFDDMAEIQAIRALKTAIKPGQSLILVTHKIRLLELVDRLIVIAPQGIVMDGPRDQVLARLQAAAVPPPAKAQAQQAAVQPAPAAPGAASPVSPGAASPVSPGAASPVSSGAASPVSSGAAAAVASTAAPVSPGAASAEASANRPAPPMPTIRVLPTPQPSAAQPPQSGGRP